MNKKTNKNKHTRTSKKSDLNKPYISKGGFRSADSTLYNIPLYRYVYRGVFSHFGVIVLLHSLFLQGLHLVHAEETADAEEQKPKVEQVETFSDAIANIKEPESKGENVGKSDNEKKNVETSGSSDATEQNNVKLDTDHKADLEQKESEKLEDVESVAEEESVGSDLDNKDVLDKNEKGSSTKSTTTPDFEASTEKSSSSEILIESTEDFSLNGQTNSASTTEKKSDTSTTTSGQIGNTSTTTIKHSVATTTSTSSDVEVEVVGATTSDAIKNTSDYDSDSSKNEISDNNEEQSSDDVATTTVKTDREGNLETVEIDGGDTTDLKDKQTETEAATTSSESLDESQAFSSTSAPVNHELVSVTRSDSEITFDKNECTELANGSFYCYQVSDTGLADSLFASPDQDGDLEIFLVRNGKQAQLTNNKVDDASPYYDSTTNTIVWHRSVNDRYQIISYDIDSQKETQLTFDSVNNMEPTKQGKYTVWQRWLNNSWNIILHDGEEEIEITNNSDHNVAPHLQGNLVVWNKHNSDNERTIEMYNIETEAYVTVNDPDGMTVDNPRMVLIYDSLQPNGEIVTKGYNIFTGEFIKLDTLPRQLPDIPDSESTTEVRALIQPKPEIKYDLEIKNDDDTDIVNDDSINTSKATTTKEASATTTSFIQSDEFDLLVEKKIAEPESEVGYETDYYVGTSTDEEKVVDNNNIPDLEIPTFRSSTTASSSENVQ